MNKIKTNRTMTYKDVDEKSTKTSKFIKFAAKSCLLPIDVSKERKLFNLRSWNCFIHIAIYIIGIAILDYSVEELVFGGSIGKCIFASNFIGAVYCVAGVVFDIIYRFGPLILSYGLQNLDPAKLCKNDLKWPKQGYPIIFGKFSLCSIADQ